MAETSAKLCCLGCIDDEDIIICCNSKLHTLCIQCFNVWLRSKTSESNSFNYKCPLYSECGSEFDPNLVLDIACQKTENAQGVTVENLQNIELNAAVRDTMKITCPNCPYFYTEDIQNDIFVELYADCPMCKTSFCLTCRHSLGRHGYRDHVCAGDTLYDKQRVRHELAEILTDAATFRCRKCKASGAPITKQEGDCNVIKCTECSHFYCYICNKELGLRNMRAHENFPHTNEFIPNAPHCWLFDEIEANKTMDEAIKLRQIYRVNKYFNALQISRTEKEKLIVYCGDLLGNLRDKTLCDDDNHVRDCTIL